MPKSKEIVHEGKLNEIIITNTVRENGTRRIQFGFDNSPSMSEQHTAKDSDLNYLIKKYRPDELSLYLAARTAHKREIMDHDFSEEPNLQEAKNGVLRIKQMFEALPEDIRKEFKGPVEFLKFIDNKENVEKMIKMGLLKPKQIEEVQKELDGNRTRPTTPTEEKKEVEVKTND